MSIDENIHNRRKMMGYTLEELAKRAGVSTTTILRYERGEIKTIGHDKIKKLADALDTTPEQLLGWEDTSDISHTPTERKLLLLARRADKIPQPDRDAILQVFENSIDVYLKAKRHAEDEK
mgnify:FL=1